MPPDPRHISSFFFSLAILRIWVLKFLFFSTLTQHTVTFLWLLLIGWKVCCTCTRIYFAAVPEYVCIYIYIFFFFFFFFFFLQKYPNWLYIAVRWLGTFANILFFEHQNDIFNGILRITKYMSGLNIKLTDLQMSDFHAPECCFIVMTYWNKLQLLGPLPPDPYQGLCPWTPLRAYCGPQTPTSFSFFTFPQSHVYENKDGGSVNANWRYKTDIHHEH